MNDENKKNWVEKLSNFVKNFKILKIRKSFFIKSAKFFFFVFQCYIKNMFTIEIEDGFEAP